MVSLPLTPLGSTWREEEEEEGGGRGENRVVGDVL